MRKALLFTMFMALSGLSLAEIHDVTIIDFAFMPASLNVSAGDTVRWTNQDAAPHTSTSDTGIWDSGTLTNGHSYMRAFAEAGNFPYHCTVHPMMMASVTVQATTGINDPGSSRKPEKFTLKGNYPNPFNASTTIEFAAANDGRARVEIYDITGRLVQIAFDGIINAGEHSVIWDAAEHASGVYFYRLTLDNRAETKAMTLLK